MHSQLCIIPDLAESVVFSHQQLSPVDVTKRAVMALAAQVSLTARLPCTPCARVQAARRCCAGRALAVRARAEAKSDDGLVSRAVNWLSVAVKNSPANSVKQAIAKAQAGDYDEKAVAARLESYINDHKVRGQRQPGHLRHSQSVLTCTPRHGLTWPSGRLSPAAQRRDVRLQVVVFSWTACPFCKKAKALLRDLGTDFTAVELDQMGSEGSALRCELARVRPECTGRRQS